jgi:hypothetical protein
MADNVTIGTGDNVAADDVSGVKFQIVKLDFGGNGLSAPVSDSVPTFQRLGAKTFTTAAPTGTAVEILSANAVRKSAVIRNHGGQTVFLGKNSSVTIANGFPVYAGESFSDNESNDAWFAITEGSTGDLRMVQVT